MFAARPDLAILAARAVETRRGGRCVQIMGVV
jgi:hypothetical protein